MKPILVISIFSLCFGAFAQEIKIPTTNDRYADYVKKLEAGITDIDYTDFRNSFLESKQYELKSTEYIDLRKKLYAAADKSDYKEVVSITKAMLGFDYTSLVAHKYLQQTYKKLGDTINSAKYHDIEFGLLNSIIHSGDGKTCETGWHVTQIEEEYFILNMLDGKFKQQNVTTGGNNVCDKMVIQTETGELETYYFEANTVFEMESKMLEKD